MESFNVQPPQYDRYDYMSRAASAGGSIDTPELQSANRFATASLVCGIVGLCTLVYFGIGALVGGLGLTFAIIAGKKGNSSGKRKTGMVLSIIAISIGVIILTIIALLEGA